MRPPLRLAPVLAPLLAPLLAACPAAPAGPPPAAQRPTWVDAAKIVVSAPKDGVITVTGKPGAIAGEPATTVTLTVLREPPSPASYALLHLGGGLPIGSGYAAVAADGSFSEGKVGSPERPVQTGDELNVTPQRGLVQTGEPVAVKVP